MIKNTILIISLVFTLFMISCAQSDSSVTSLDTTNTSQNQNAISEGVIISENSSYSESSASIISGTSTNELPTSNASSQSSASPPEISSSTENFKPVEPNSSTVSLTLDNASFSNDELINNFVLRGVIINDSSENIQPRAEYSVERLTEGQWVEFQYNTDNLPNWPSTSGNVIQANSHGSISYIYWDFNEEIVAGTYRICQIIYNADLSRTFTITSTFDVK